MSMLHDFDFSQFKSKDEILVENLRIENCRITGIQCKFLRILKCNFKNVVFDNSIYEVYTNIKNCEFNGCIFHDTFEGDDLELAIGDSVFSNCLFEGISYQSFSIQSNITNCKLLDCHFKNIQIKGDLCFTGLEINGGEVEHFHFYGNQILQNNLFDIKLKDVSLVGALIQNKMENVIFKNVTLKGYNMDNTFLNCDTNEFTFVPL